MLISPFLDAEPASEFVHWIAQRGDGGKIVREHVAAQHGACASCGRRWPCGLLRCAERSFRLCPHPGPPGRPALSPHSPAGLEERSARGWFGVGAGRAVDGAVTIWRGETFWSDGVRVRARWLGRADYPDADAACWWLAISLETLRHRQESGGPGCFWGEVTAGRVGEDGPDGGDGTVVLGGGWRPIEERGATATACLRASAEPIAWGGRPQ